MPTLPTLFQNSKHTDSIITDLQNAHYNHLKHIFLQLLRSICRLKQKYQSLGLSPQLGLLRFQARPKPTSSPHPGLNGLGSVGSGLEAQPGCYILGFGTLLSIFLLIYGCDFILYHMTIYLCSQSQFNSESRTFVP